MKKRRIHYWIGLNGVDVEENPRAKHWARLLEIPAIVVALCLLVLWYMESRGIARPSYSSLVDYGVWFYFLGETLGLTLLVDNPRRYLRDNWLNVAIILLGIPVLWGYAPYATGLRSLRLLIILTLLLPLSDTLRRIMARNHLGTTLLISALVVFIAGYLMAGIDPNIKTPEDGIWWAWVTVSGVGYGDVVPGSTEGRILAALLIIFGIALFSIVTANLSVFFISRAEISGELGAQEKPMKHIEARLQRIEDQLADIDRKIERLGAARQRTDQ